MVMKRVGFHGNDLEALEKLNALSRRMTGDVARQVVYIGVGVSGLVTLLQQIL